MQTQLETMGKVELRAACKGARVKNYSKMSVATMRAALAALTPAAPMETAFSVPPKADEPVVKTKRVRVVAVEQNGVKRPGKGVCADVWAACDALLAKGAAPDSATMRELAAKHGWNLSNVSIELSRWRKYTGVARPTKAA